MYLKIIKEAILLLLAFLDSEFTKRKLSKFGFEVEMNPVVRFLARYLGGAGVDIGVCVPTVILGFLGWYCNDLLVFLIGIRFCLFLFQRIAESNGAN